MPFTAFLCEIDDKPVPISECIACARHGAPGSCSFLPEVLEFLATSVQPGHTQLEEARSRLGAEIQKAFSVTELLECTRRARLAEQLEWAEKPSRLYRMMARELFHAAPAALPTSGPFRLSSSHLWMRANWRGHPVAVSGTIDRLIYRKSEGGWVVVDQKTVREAPASSFRIVCRLSGKPIYTSASAPRARRLSCPYCLAHHTAAEVQIEVLPPCPPRAHILQLQLETLLVEANRETLARAANAALGASGSTERISPHTEVVGCELVYFDPTCLRRIRIPLMNARQRQKLLEERLEEMLDEAGREAQIKPELHECKSCSLSGLCLEVYGERAGALWVDPLPAVPSH